MTLFLIRIIQWLFLLFTCSSNIPLRTHILAPKPSTSTEVHGGSARPADVMAETFVYDFLGSDKLKLTL